MQSKTLKPKKKITKTTRKIRRLRRIVRNKVRRKLGRRNKNRMPAAFTTNFSKLFKIIKQDGNSMTVKGRDLVYQIPDSLVSNYQTTNLITIIPCNPAYWLGTRVSALATGYQNYRPLKFIVHYVPQCAVTQQGNVIAGTLWNQIPGADNLQQTLRTSSGGMLTQCYKSAKSNVSMKSNLQFNLFRTAGKFDQESNPFNFIAIAVGCSNEYGDKIVPGYFYVDWEFTFKNPIGYSTSFLNSGLKYIKDIEFYTSNNSSLIIAEERQYNNFKTEIGMLIQVDNVDGKIKFTYNNTDAPLVLGGDLLVWAFQNKPINSTSLPQNDQITYYYNNTSISTNSVRLDGHTMMIYQNTDQIITYINISENVPVEINVPNGTRVYFVTSDNSISKNDELGYWEEDIYIEQNVIKFIYEIDENDAIEFILES